MRDTRRKFIKMKPCGSQGVLATMLPDQASIAPRVSKLQCGLVFTNFLLTPSKYTCSYTRDGGLLARDH